MDIVQVHPPTDRDFRDLLRLAEAMNAKGPTRLGSALRNMAIYSLIKRDSATLSSVPRIPYAPSVN